MAGGRLTSIELINFKAFRHLFVNIQNINILVGPNNSGKSTVLGACRALAFAIRHAHRKKAEAVAGIEGHTLGWNIDAQQLPMSVDNVRHDYKDDPTFAKFTF